MNASRDENNVPTLLGTLDTDGQTVIPIQVNPSNHGLRCNDSTSGSDNGPDNAPRDANQVPALMGVSSVDGKTPVIVYSDANGKLLIDST